MDAVQLLTHEMNGELAKVREIVDTADGEVRAISSTERETYETAMKRVADLKSRIGDEVEKNRVREMVDGFGKMKTGEIDLNPVREPAQATKFKTPGEALINSDGFKAWQAVTKSAGKVERFTTPSVEVPYGTKTAGDPLLESGNTELFGTGGAAGAMSTLFGLETPGFVQPRLTIADLLQSVPITVGNSASYPVVDVRTRISGTPQTEGSAKPGGEYSFDVETKVLVTLAGWVKVSTQFLEDAPGLAAYINADLPFQIRQNEEAYLATALYAAAGAATAVTGGTSQFDAILDAKTTIQLENFEPTAIVIHPADWAILLAEKFTDDHGYVGGGPFTATNNPWGLRVVVTQAATEGSPLVGDFARGAKVYRRGGMSVASTNSDGTDFQKNLITIRAELREVVGVTYPEAFAEATVNS